MTIRSSWLRFRQILPPVLHVWDGLDSVRDYLHSSAISSDHQPVRLGRLPSGPGLFLGMDASQAPKRNMSSDLAENSACSVFACPAATSGHRGTEMTVQGIRVQLPCGPTTIVIGEQFCPFRGQSSCPHWSRRSCDSLVTRTRIHAIQWDSVFGRSYVNDGGAPLTKVAVDPVLAKISPRMDWRYEAAQRVKVFLERGTGDLKYQLKMASSRIRRNNTYNFLWTICLRDSIWNMAWQILGINL